MADVDEAPRVCVFAPTPLLTVSADQTPDHSRQLHIHVGGQGIWVARTVSVLGGRPEVCAAFGGETGLIARFLAGRERFGVHGVEVAGWNGGYVHERCDGTRRELVDVLPEPLSRHETDELYSMTLSLALSCDVCVVTGTQRGDVLPDAFYGRLAADLRTAGTDAIGDLTGGGLAAFLTGRPAMIKLSDEELRAEGWIDGRSIEETVSAIHRLRAAGARDVVVSRGMWSTVAAIGDEIYVVRSPRLQVVDERGGGDAMTAALATARAQGMEPLDGVRLAAAAGAATVTRQGLGTAAPELIDAVKPRITIDRLPSG